MPDSLSAHEEGEIIIISECVGKEIDQDERDRFKLFEGIKGFQSAICLKLSESRYLFKLIISMKILGK